MRILGPLRVRVIRDGRGGPRREGIGLAFGLTLNALAMDLIGYGRTARLVEEARQCADALV